MATASTKTRRYRVQRRLRGKGFARARKDLGFFRECPPRHSGKVTPPIRRRLRIHFRDHEVVRVEDRRYVRAYNLIDASDLSPAVAQRFKGNLTATKAVEVEHPV